MYAEIRARYLNYKYNEQARAPHTTGSKDVTRCGALSLLQKPLHYKTEVIVVLRPLFAAVLVVRRRYLIMVPRPLPATPLVVHRRYLAMVPRPMPAAVASRCCRRRFQQLACACGS
jgi:hypothetical protein